MGVPVIIDSDPGVDDALAILLALASPEIDIKAIIVTYGNTEIDASYLNVFRIYRAVERHLSLHPEQRSRFPNFDPGNLAKQPFLVRGTSMPLEGDLHSAQYFHGRDGLAGITERHADLDDGMNVAEETSRYFRQTDRSASDVVLNILREEPSRTVTYLALGPMTTLAHVVRQDRTAFREQIGRVACMGGALDVCGNTSPVAEFNWFADPYAVQELLMSDSAGLPLERFFMLPLDITTPHDMSFPTYKEYVDPAFESTARPSDGARKPPLQHFTSAFLERTREIMISFGKDALELHDPVALWFVIENPLDQADHQHLSPGWRTLRRVFSIERTGELTRGMCVVDRREDPSAYVPGANRAYVQSQRLRHQYAAGGEQDAVIVQPARVEVENASQAHPPGQTSSQKEGNAATVAAEAKGEEAGGISVVIETPGPEAMLRILFRRIWGVEM